jgi:DNA-binding NarL/FixJ family response regulator
VAIRVAVAEDNLLVREGLERLLALQPDIEVVASCADLPALIAAVEETSPDVLVTDIRMPPDHTDEGIRAALELRGGHPDLGVVVLSQFADPSYALALLEAGSERRAYLLKDRIDDVEQLVGAIRAVADGGSVVDPKVVEVLVRARSGGADSPLDELTPRELDVMREMAQGKNNAAIAEALVLSERSVEKYVHAIFAKLGLAWEANINRRVKAVLLYLGDDPR